MSLNQYAIYQLKMEAPVRPLRYKTFTYLIENHLKVDADNYHQVYLTTMIGEQTPEEIRRQLEKNLPPKFMGNALNVSDVIAVTKEGISTAYYVDKTGLVVIPGFFRNNSSATLITMDTEGFVFEDRKGSWMATDETVIDGRQFFLMVSETYGRNAAFAVVDDQGRQAAEDTFNGFDDKTTQQIRQYMNPPEQQKKPPAADKPQMEIWQKYYENGEYLRAAESYGEQNFDMIDGRANNRPKEDQRKPSAETTEKTVVGKKPEKEPEKKNDLIPSKRKSVLKRLREKQAEVAARYGKKEPEKAKDDMERNRK